jgi:preprotein translocase subunit Sss1
MSTLHQKIRDEFLKKLGDDAKFDAAMIEKLRMLLSQSKKPRPDEFAQIFTAPVEGDVK